MGLARELTYGVIPFADPRWQGAAGIYAGGASRVSGGWLAYENESVGVALPASTQAE